MASAEYSVAQIIRHTETNRLLHPSWSSQAYYNEDIDCDGSRLIAGLGNINSGKGGAKIFRLSGSELVEEAFIEPPEIEKWADDFENGTKELSESAPVGTITEAGGKLTISVGSEVNAELGTAPIAYDDEDTYGPGAYGAELSTVISAMTQAEDIFAGLIIFDWNYYESGYTEREYAYVIAAKYTVALGWHIDVLTRSADVDSWEGINQSIADPNTTPLHLRVNYSGYDDAIEFRYSQDGGTTWTSISYDKDLWDPGDLPIKAGLFLANANAHPAGSASFDFIECYGMQVWSMFGSHVGISDDLAVVGAFDGDVVRVYARDGETWSLDGEITYFAEKPNARFYGVRVDGDVIGILDEYDDDAGTNAGGINLLERTAPGTYSYLRTVANPFFSQSARNYYGIGLRNGFEMRGGKILCGDEYGGMKVVAAEEFNDESLSLTATLPNSTAEQLLEASDKQTGDKYGNSVSSDGDWAVVGAPGANVSGNPYGAAYVLHRSAGSWSQYDKLPNYNPGATHPNFGTAVAISEDWVAVGSPGVGANGEVHLYQNVAGTWTWQQTLTGDDESFGSALSMDSIFLIVGAPEFSGGCGQAQIFMFSGGSWSYDGGASSGVQGNIGYSVAIRRWYDVDPGTVGTAFCVIGAPTTVHNSIEAGAVYSMVRLNGTWGATSYSPTSYGDYKYGAGARYGHSVSLPPFLLASSQDYKTRCRVGAPGASSIYGSHYPTGIVWSCEVGYDSYWPTWDGFSLYVGGEETCHDETTAVEYGSLVVSNQQMHAVVAPAAASGNGKLYTGIGYWTWYAKDQLFDVATGSSTSECPTSLAANRSTVFVGSIGNPASENGAVRIGNGGSRAVERTVAEAAEYDDSNVNLYVDGSYTAAEWGSGVKTAPFVHTTSIPLPRWPTDGGDAFVFLSFDITSASFWFGHKLYFDVDSDWDETYSALTNGCRFGVALSDDNRENVIALDVRFDPDQPIVYTGSSYRDFKEIQTLWKIENNGPRTELWTSRVQISCATYGCWGKAWPRPTGEYWEPTLAYEPVSGRCFGYHWQGGYNTQKRTSPMQTLWFTPTQFGLFGLAPEGAAYLLKAGKFITTRQYGTSRCGVQSVSDGSLVHDLIMQPQQNTSSLADNSAALSQDAAMFGTVRHLILIRSQFSDIEPDEGIEFHYDPGFVEWYDSSGDYVGRLSGDNPGSAFDDFGWSVDTKGAYAAVGAPAVPVTATADPAVYIFQKEGALLSKIAKVELPDVEYFGHNVAMFNPSSAPAVVATGNPAADGDILAGGLYLLTGETMTAVKVPIGALYVDGLRYEDPSGCALVINQIPQDEETGVSTTASINLHIVSLENVALDATAKVWITPSSTAIKTLAYDQAAGGFQSGFSGTATVRKSPGSLVDDELVLSFTRSTPFVSKEIVLVEVYASTSLCPPGGYETDYWFEIEDITAATIESIFWLRPHKCRVKFNEPVLQTNAPGGALYVNAHTKAAEVIATNQIRLPGVTLSSEMIGYYAAVYGSAYPRNNGAHVITGVNTSTSVLTVATTNLIPDDGRDVNEGDVVVRRRELSVSITPYKFTARLSDEGAAKSADHEDRIQCGYEAVTVLAESVPAAELPTGEDPDEYIYLTVNQHISFNRLYTITAVKVEDLFENAITEATLDFQTPSFGMPERLSMWSGGILSQPEKERDLANQGELRKMAVVLQDIFNVLWYEVDQLQYLPEPDRCKTEWVPHLLYNRGNPFRFPIESEEMRRKLGEALRALYVRIGTADGIIDMVYDLLGVVITIHPYIDEQAWILDDEVYSVLGETTILAAHTDFARNCYEIHTTETLTAVQVRIIRDIARWADPPKMHLVRIVDAVTEYEYIDTDLEEVNYTPG